MRRGKNEFFFLLLLFANILYFGFLFIFIVYVVWLLGEKDMFLSTDIDRNLCIHSLIHIVFFIFMLYSVNITNDTKKHGSLYDHIETEVHTKQKFRPKGKNLFSP